MHMGMSQCYLNTLVLYPFRGRKLNPIFSIFIIVFFSQAPIVAGEEKCGGGVGGGGNDRLAKQTSAQLFQCQQEYYVIGGRITPCDNTGSIFAPRRICVITLAGSHPVLQVEKQLKAFLIKSVPTVADFRTKSLGNLAGMYLYFFT